MKELISVTLAIVLCLSLTACGSRATSSAGNGASEESKATSHDYCGVMSDPLTYDEADVHNGWQNGDIDFATDGNYFTILYKDEDISQQFAIRLILE